MISHQESLRKKAVRETVILSVLYPCTILFLLAPFSFLAGLITKNEMVNMLGDVYCLVIMMISMIFALVIQYAAWKRIDKYFRNHSGDTVDERFLFRQFLVLFLNFFLIVNLQLILAELVFFYFFPLEIDRKYIIVYGISLIYSFATLVGSFFLNYIFRSTEEYFRSINPKLAPFFPMSFKITSLITALTMGIIALFVSINDLAKTAQAMGRTLPIPLTISNMIIAVTAIIFMTLVLNSLKKSIVHPLRALGKAFSIASEGDLRVSIPVVTGDEISEIAIGANHFIESMKENIGSMMSVITNIASNKGNLDKKLGSLLSMVEDIDISIRQTKKQMSVHKHKVEETSTTIEQLARKIDFLAIYIDEESEKVKEFQKINKFSMGEFIKIGELMKFVIQKMESEDNFEKISEEYASVLQSVREIGRINDNLKDSMKTMNSLETSFSSSLNKMRLIAGNILSNRNEMRVGNLDIVDAISEMNDINRTVDDVITEFFGSTEILANFNSDVRDQIDITEQTLETLNGIINQFSI